jgi:uncharacterized 2Fe-2S/4Fe-4S cluster protein (DUF4445 family)
MSEPFVVFMPSGRRGRVPPGTTVLQAARLLGVDLDSVCGGRGICSRCQIEPGYGAFPKLGVTSTPEALSPWNAVEARYDDKRGLTAGRRLGCQAEIRGDVVIDVPAASQVHRQVVRKAADARPVVMDPASRLLYVEVGAARLDDPAGDLERLRRALAGQWQIDDVRCGLRALARLRAALGRQQDVTLALHGDQIVDVWPGYRGGPLTGLAIDVGSTTVAAHLCALDDGRVLASAGIMNPQIRFGEDLMSRVSHAMMDAAGAGRMTAAIREALSDLAGELLAEAEADPEMLVEAVVVGNPVMHHLLLGLDPVPLGQAPFALGTSEPLDFPAAEIGLSGINPSARVHVLPCIAGHVGADAAAVVLATRPDLADELTLVVDVGTNAEIVLGNRERLLACSSPTGPAFEGAQISSGQRAAPGAIERVRIDPATAAPRFRVIGCDLWSDEPGFAEATAVTGVSGICGSGIIEAVAEMRLAGLVDASGLIGGPERTGTDRSVADGRTFAYLLHEADGRRILVTQSDVRAIQLAKSALYAGARLLMDEIGVDAVDRVILAGAFGAHISPRHALILGMIPDCDEARVTSAGNAAGAGARIALLSRAARAEIAAIARRIEKVETAIEPRFQEHFVAANAIPHATAGFARLRGTVTLPDVSFGATGSREGGRRRRRA